MVNHPNIINRVGVRSFHQVCIRDSGLRSQHNHGAVLWAWLCDCGNIANRTYGDALRTKSCGKCHISREARSAASKGRPQKFKTEPGETGLRRMFEIYGRRARKRGIQFTLTIEEFKEITSSNCFYCGASPSQVYRHTIKDRSERSAKHSEYVNNSVDKIDPNGGYIIGNCVPACKTCNIMKWDHSEEEFRAHIVRLYFNHVLSGRRAERAQCEGQ